MYYRLVEISLGLRSNWKCSPALQIGYRLANDLLLSHCALSLRWTSSSTPTAFSRLQSSTHGQVEQANQVQFTFPPLYGSYTYSPPPAFREFKLAPPKQLGFAMTSFVRNLALVSSLSFSIHKHINSNCYVCELGACVLLLSVSAPWFFCTSHSLHCDHLSHHNFWFHVFREFLLCLSNQSLTTFLAFLIPWWTIWLSPDCLS